MTVLANVVMNAVLVSVLIWYVVAKRRQRARGERGRVRVATRVQVATEAYLIAQTALLLILIGVLRWGDPSRSRLHSFFTVFAASVLVVQVFMFYLRRVRPTFRRTGGGLA